MNSDKAAWGLWGQGWADGGEGSAIFSPFQQLTGFAGFFVYTNPSLLFSRSPGPFLNSVGSSSEQTPPKNNTQHSSSNNNNNTGFFHCQTILERDVGVESAASSPPEEHSGGLHRETNFFPKIFAEVGSAALGCTTTARVRLERVETVSISNLHLL
jgi:hypothetical protein